MIRTLYPRPWQLRAALDGRLSMVAVMLKEQPASGVGPEFSTHWHWQSKSGAYLGAITHPFSPGDLLVCKEAWNLFQCSRDGDVSWPFRSVPKEDPRDDPDARSLIVVDYPVCSPCVPGYDAGKGPWRSPVTMPRWASRMTWEVESVRVCRVQDVTEDEARACGLEWVAPTYGVKGIAGSWNGNPREAFAGVWTADHGPDAWERNPWIALYAIRVHLCNVKEIKNA